MEVIEKMRREHQQAREQIEGLTNLKLRSNEWHSYNIDYFNRFDGLLDKNDNGPFWLRNPEVAEVVEELIHYRDKKDYDLIAYCIMPNHVHMVFEINTVGRLAESTSMHNGRDSVSTYMVTQILESLKKFTAIRANRILHRSGQFWQRESYDHVIRDDNDLSRIVDYVLWNPVKAGLAESWEEWSWSYVKKEYYSQ